MKSSKLKVIGVILINIGFIVYLGAFFYQIATIAPDFREIVGIILQTLFVVYVNVDTFANKTNSIFDKLNK